MKVPHRYSTRTNPSRQGLAPIRVQADPEAFGLSVSRELGRLGATVTEQMERRQARDESFRAKKLFVEETTALRQDFQEKQVNAPLGAEGFTQTVLGDYEERHQGLLSRMQEQGFSQEAVNEVDLKLAGLRENIVGQSLRFQSESYAAKVESDVSDLGVDLTNIAAANPGDMDSALTELNEAVDAIPDLTAAQKESFKNQASTSIKMAAGLGLASQDPKGVIDALSAGEATDYFAAIRQQESGGDDAAKNPRSSATGRYQFTKDTWENLRQRYPDAGLTSGGRLDPDQQEIAIRLFTEDNREALAAAGIPDTNANLYAAHFLGAGGAVDVLNRSNDTSLSSILPENVMSANPHLRGMNVAAFKQWANKAGGGGGGQAFAGKTGDPVLDSLDFSQRQKVLRQARSYINQRKVDLKAPLDLIVDNAEAAYLTTGEYDGPIPTPEQFVSAYGPVEGTQRWESFKNTQEVGEFISGMGTASEGDILSQLAELAPTDTSSPTYAADQKSYEAAVKAKDTVMESRERDPAGYVITNFPGVREAWGNMDDPEGAKLAFREMAEAYEQIGVPRNDWVAMPQAVMQHEKQNFQSLSPEGKINKLVGMQQTMGELYSAALDQYADNGMGVEAAMANLVTISPEHKATAANVLRGMEIVANDPSRKPKPETVNTNYRDIMGVAQQFLSPQMSGSLLEAASALYAFKGGDPDVNLDVSKFDESVREVIGGNPDDVNTGAVDLTSWFGNVEAKTILPPGVNKTQFMNWEEGLTQDDLVSQSTTGLNPVYADGSPASVEDIVQEGVFVQINPNQYSILMSSDGNELVTPTGERYVMEITPEVVKNVQ